MASSEQPTSVLPRHDTLAIACGADSPTAGDWSEGQRIGAFKLVRRLGKGGMGQVWLAHQLHPLIRDVALKVMLPERRSARAEAFFEVERQALAQLSHRAIAQIYDAGRLPDGALFFAMEYVPGRPLDEFLRLQPQPLLSLVRMFVELCGGIQHAHQRGLIHRDLKPQNVLVQDTEAGPLPRIIDFGIALGASADGPTPMQASQVAGTPAYMAPEQREPGPAGIDARCDIYALGVMLAECLRQQVGLPFDSRAPESTALREEFARSLQARLPSDGDAQQLRRAPFELRAIVLKAMAEDREQRYASAASMAEDLQRWLQREPVLAVAGGRGYTLRCFLRRNALATAAGSLIGLALIGGTGLALYGLTEARAGRAQAEAAQALAEQRRGEAEQLIQYMLGDFADKLRPLGRLDLLDSIGAEALKYLGGADARGDARSNLARARALRTLGEVQVTRQQFEQAGPVLEQAARLLDEALGSPERQEEQLHFEAGQVAFWRGHIAYSLRDYLAAETHMARYLSEARAFDEITEDHQTGQQEIAYALNNLGSLMLAKERPSDALKYFEQAAGVRESMLKSDSDPRVLDLVDSLSWVANAQEGLGRPRAALESRKEALDRLLAHERAAGASPRARRFEINLRYSLDVLSDLLGQERADLNSLLRAATLAREDAANDPTQPRRQVLLALIAYRAAVKTSDDVEASGQHFVVAERAHQAVSSSQLPEGERLRVSGARCLALQQINPTDADCVTEVMERVQLLRSAEASTVDLDLLYVELAAHLTDDKSLHWPEAFRILAKLPDSSSQTLRYLVAKRSLLQRSNPSIRDISEIDRMITDLRTVTAPLPPPRN